MKKIFSISFFLCAVLSFTGCVSEEEDIFDKSAAERLNEASDLYSARLGAQPNGWAMQLYPTMENEAPYGNGYLVLCDFNPNYTVKVAMNNSLTSNAYMEDLSMWEVLTDNGAVLSFNTYNKVMHMFSSPEDVPSTGTADEPNNETGKGIGGDYEFIIVDAPEDASYMMLKGKKRGTYNLLTPVEEGVNYEAYLADVKAFHSQMFPSNAPTFDVIHLGDSLLKMEGTNDGIPNIYPYDQDAILNESFNPFLVTKRGDSYYLRFRDARKVDDTRSVQEFRYMPDQDIFQSTNVENCYIDGDDPVRFFHASVTGGERGWTWKNAAETSSEGYSTLYTNLYDQLKAKGYTLQNLALRELGGELIFRLTVRKSTNTSIDFLFTVSKEEDGVTLVFSGAKNAAGETIMNQTPALQDMINFLSQKFIITAGKTKFNLNTIKLTSASDSNMWFVATLQ